MCKRLLGAAVLACVLGADALAFEDTEGRNWRALSETEGITWAQAAKLCPVNGQHACKGTINGVDLSGYVWATRRQVMDLFNIKLSAAMKLDASQPARFGIDQLSVVESFLAEVMKPNHSFCINYACGEGVMGLTASRAGQGGVYVGAALWHRTPVTIEAGFTVATLVDGDRALTDHGLWMFRTAASATTVPEPSTALLLAAGVAVLARRRRQPIASSSAR
jgi:hypothetical protein